MGSLHIVTPVVFQSTHPVRGATCVIRIGSAVLYISIHAPREGCDLAELLADEPTLEFQSTHPVRGATLRVVLIRPIRYDFNPRTP